MNMSPSKVEQELHDKYRLQKLSIREKIFWLKREDCTYDLKVLERTKKNAKQDGKFITERIFREILLDIRKLELEIAKIDFELHGIQHDIKELIEKLDKKNKRTEK